MTLPALTLPALMFTPGPVELVVILVLVLFCVGAGKLPQVGKSLGEALGSSRRGLNAPEE